MYLKYCRRKKDGKAHRCWSIVESRRASSGRVAQRQVLYLGEINDSKREAWRKTIEALEHGGRQAKQMALFPADAPVGDQSVVQVQLDKLSLHRPRLFGGCWLFDRLWRKLNLEAYRGPRLPPSHKGTRWVKALETLTACTLLGGGSEWRLHRQWYGQTAMADLLGEDFGLVQKDKLCRCLTSSPLIKTRCSSSQGKVARPVRRRVRRVPLRLDLDLFRERSAGEGQTRLRL